MNFMGMGIMEIGVVMVVAFLVLGPSRAIDTARTAGRLMRDLRRTFSEVMEAVDMERDQQSGPQGQVPTDGPSGGPSSGPAEFPPSQDDRPAPGPRG